MLQHDKNKNQTMVIRFYTLIAYLITDYVQTQALSHLYTGSIRLFMFCNAKDNQEKIW